MDYYKNISETLINGAIDSITDTVKAAIDSGLSAENIMEKGLLAGMDIVGQRFKADEMFIPEVLRCAKCMNDATEILKPFFKEGNSALSKGKIVIGTVQGDLHDIGKNIVAMMFEASGYEVIDIGIDQPPENFIEAIQTHQPQIVGISALLTTTIPKMTKTVAAIKEAGLHPATKIIVGGAPVTEEFAIDIGADAYGKDGASAVDRVAYLLAQ